VGSHVNVSRASRVFRRPDEPPDDLDTRVVLDGLRLLVRALRVSARRAEGLSGISGAQLFVLQTLGEAGPLSISDLALRTHTDPSSVSVVVSRLALRGLVVRAESKVDARRAEIRLTAAGRSRLRRSPESMQAQLIVALRGLRPASRRQLGRSLGELVGAMGLSDEPRMFFEEDPQPKEKEKKKNGA
jgi:MarR family transcriptional regulator, lower aerobic nicotinate degradation pathway regulator